MKKTIFSTFIAILLCCCYFIQAFSFVGNTETTAHLILNESFELFPSELPAGFIIYNKAGGEITGEQVDENYHHSLKYHIVDRNKVDVSLQYNFSSPISGKLVLETKIRAEQDNLFFPIFQLRDGNKNNVLGSLSNGKITVGSDKISLTSYTTGQWYHLHFAIDLASGKMDVYLNKEKKLENISFWSKDKTNNPIEVKKLTSFKNYLKGQSGKALTVYQDDLRIYTGNTPIFDDTFFSQPIVPPENNTPISPLEPLPDYYENPSANKIISDLKAFNPNGEHPRLFLRKSTIAQLQEKIQQDALVRSWYENLKKQGNKLLKEPVGTPDLKDGRRMQAAKDARPRIETTALLYLLSGEEKYRDRAISEIKAVIQFPNWNHDKEFLNTAEMAAGVAIGYDWLYHELTEELRQEIRIALIEKALKKAKEAYAANVWWYQKRELINNWNAVCNGGIGMAALAIGDEAPKIAGHVLEKAIPSLERAILMEFIPDGGWAEGPGYWRYTIEYVVSFLASLESSVGSMYGMEKTPGLKETSYFPIYLTGSCGSFNYADSSSNKMKMPELFWLAQKLNDPSIARARLNLMKEANQTGDIYDILWYQPNWDTPLTLELDKYFGKTEVFTMRSKWNDPYATFVGFKGGKGYNSHAHLDIGNFVFQANGETWAEDIGSDNYTGRYFNYDEHRFHYYRAKPEGHNTIVINPDGTYQQNHHSENPIEKIESKPQGAFAILNMSGAYEKNAISAKRGIMLTNHREILIVQDEISLKQPSAVYWFMHSTADITIQPDRKAVVLEKNGKKLWLEVLSPNKEELQFQVGPAVALPTEPVIPDQADNSKFKRIILSGNPQSSFELSVALIPLKYGEDKPSFLPQYSPFSEWTIPDGESKKPTVSAITVNGLKLADFSADQYYYDIALPFGSQQLPLISAESEFPLEITQAKTFLDSAVITVKDSQNPQNFTRYVLRFRVLPSHSQPVNAQKLPISLATASAYQNQPEKSQVNPPEHAIDGNDITRWAAEGNQWLCLELKEIAEVDCAAIAFVRGNNRIFQFEIETSLDGKLWQTLYKGANSGTGIDLEYFSLKASPAKYVRIQGKGNSQNQWNTYSEAEVWGRPLQLASPASKAALEAFVASASAIRLKPEYIKNSPHKQAILDQALSEAENGLQNSALKETECQALYINLENALKLIKTKDFEEDILLEPLRPYIPESTSLIENTLPAEKIDIKNHQLPPESAKNTELLAFAKKNLAPQEENLLTVSLSARSFYQRKIAAAQLSFDTLENIRPLLLASYYDISKNTWYAKEVSALALLDLFIPSSEQAFNGAQPITNQELAALFTRFCGQSTTFSERPLTYFFLSKPEIEWENNFSPLSPLTRENAAYLIVEFAKNQRIPFSSAKITSDKFSDHNSIRSSYKIAVEQVHNAGIMRGYPDGTFQPKALVSRQEIAVIFYRLLKASLLHY